MALREIAATVLSQRRRESRANDSVANREEKPYAENKENPERSVEDGTGLQDGGRLLDSQSGGSRSPGAGQVWDAAAQLPPAAPQRNLHRDDALEQAGSAPRGDRPAGQRDDGAADTADGAAAGRDREPESVRPDGVGEPDEQHPGGSGGDGADRADLQLTSPPEARVEDFKVKVGPTGLEVSFHDFTARSGIDYYHEDSEKNELLRTSDALREHRKEIAAFFADHSDSRERGDFVKGFFNNTYVEAILSNGQRAGYRAWDDVLTLWRGSYPSREKEEYLRWPQVANTIEGMILLQQWLSPEEQSLPSEVEQISFIEQVEAEKASAFSLPQEAIDYVLCRSVDSQSKYRIHEQYLKHEGSNANVKCLKEEYGIGGRSNIIPGSGFFEDHDSKGIRLWRSSDTDEAKREEVLIGWGKVERRIAELIATDRYLNRAEKEQYLLRQAQDKQLVNPTEPAVPDPLEPPQDSDALAEAKRIIDGFCRREFGQEADDFADLTDVALGYTTATVDEYPVEFSADLIHYRLSYWAYDKVVDTIQFDDLDEMNRYLADLDFSMMVDHAAEKYEQQQNEIKAEEKARQLISEFCENEYDSPADFSDPENVSLAHSTTGDGDHFIDVSADLPEFSLNYQVDGETVATYQCYDMVGFAELLADLSCDEMIAVAEEQYATRRKKKDQQEQETDDFADIDPAAIRAALAESGIVDGHVVDPDKLDADPFIQQVMADVEQIAENEPPSLERFSVIETEGGYAVWDDIRDEIYVDGEGVQEEFTSEWQAEDYLKQVKKEVADKEAAEWLTVERTKEMAQEPAEKENVTQAGSNAVQPGMELAMHDRRFVVDSVDEAAGTVSLRDSTFQSDTGFPIFRSERIETVQRVLTEAAQEPKAEPAKLRSIVIDLSPRPEQEPEEEPQLSAPPAPKPRKNLPPILLHPEIPSSQRRDYRITEVDIYTYVTEGTFDSYLYQMVENKQKFVGQIMTSKSPARSAEDVDETALSYAEVKALCAGDPHIKEKMDLDVEVQRLKLLKSNHLSQKYALEDQIIKYLPQTVASLEQRMEGYTSDVNRLNENTHPNQDGFSPMEVEGTVYSDKKEAGSAILAACKAMTGPDPVPLGQYRGFAMELSFESFSKEFQITLKGSLTHTTSLGTDIFGNIQRLDNLLGGMGEKMEHCKQELDNVKVQIANAKEEVEKPFAQEEELKTKQARLEELNVLLRLDKRENEIVDGERDEDGPPQITQRGVVDMER